MSNNVNTDLYEDLLEILPELSFDQLKEVEQYLAHNDLETALEVACGYSKAHSRQELRELADLNG